MAVTIKFPKVVSAVFTPNPVNKGAKVVVSVVVTEEDRALESEKRYSGELKSGEV